MSSISLITLLFQIINTAYPDALYSGYYVDPYSGGIRWAIASLIIIFPLYLLLSWLLGRDYKAVPEKRTLGVKKWLTFITLFLTGVAIATDLVVLINSFLGGEITTRFTLKVLAVLVVTGFIFGYYLWDLRRPAGSTTGMTKVFAGISVVLVLASIIGGFVIMGSPAQQRNLRLDQQKVDSLRNTQYSIVNYYQLKKALPKTLNDLDDSISGMADSMDPETGMQFEYKATSNLSFELCANFHAASPENQTYDYADPYYGVNDMSIAKGASQDNWKHSEGHFCFTRTIDPALYAPVAR